jgi:hypothetical protein
VQVCELPIDQEGLPRADRFAWSQDESPSTWNGDPAGLFEDTRQCKDTASQFLGPPRIGWLLVELHVRMGRRRAGAGANSLR